MAPKIKGIVPTPMPMPEHLKERGDYVERRLPPLIVVFVVLCFWRAFFFMLGASILGIAPDSKAAHVRETYFNPRLPHISAEFDLPLLPRFSTRSIGWGWLSPRLADSLGHDVPQGDGRAHNCCCFFAANSCRESRQRGRTASMRRLWSAMLNLFDLRLPGVLSGDGPGVQGDALR